MAGTEIAETALQSFLDGLFGRDDVPAEALHGRDDAEAAWERWMAGEPPRSSAERWLQGQFERGAEVARRGAGPQPVQGLPGSRAGTGGAVTDEHAAEETPGPAYSGSRATTRSRALGHASTARC